MPPTAFVLLVERADETTMCCEFGFLAWSAQTRVVSSGFGQVCGLAHRAEAGMKNFLERRPRNAQCVLSLTA